MSQTSVSRRHVYLVEPMWRKLFCYCFFCPSNRQTNSIENRTNTDHSNTTVSENQPQSTNAAFDFDYQHMFCSVEPLLSGPEATAGSVLDASQCSITKLANNLLNSKKKRRQIRVILLNGNQLEHIPNRVLKCKKLLVLDLSHNSLTFLPSALSHLTDLRTLLLAGNNLQQLGAGLSQLKQLHHLDLSGNQGLLNLPNEIGNCSQLRFLSVSHTCVNLLPESFEKMRKTYCIRNLTIGFLQTDPALGYMTIEEKKLSGIVGTPLHRFYGLDKENLCRFVGFETFGIRLPNGTFIDKTLLFLNRLKLTELRTLEIRETGLHSLAHHISKLPSLEKLDCGANELASLRELLQELTVDQNQLRRIPQCIKNLEQLTFLDASSNKIEEIASEISECSMHNDLTLSSNEIRELPDAFCKLTSLTILRLDANFLSKLPNDIGNLKSLEELAINDNLLESLPDSIGRLQNLQTLILDCNLLTKIPNSLTNCNQLRLLSLAENRLADLPENIGLLNNLKILTLSGNNLTHLPASLVNIPSLNALWLSDNQSKPMISLQNELHSEKKVEILTCVLLPQRKHSQESSRTSLNDYKPTRKQSKSEIYLNNFKQNLDGNLLLQRKSSNQNRSTDHIVNDNIKLSNIKKIAKKDRDKSSPPVY